MDLETRRLTETRRLYRTLALSPLRLLMFFLFETFPVYWSVSSKLHYLDLLLICCTPTTSRAAV